MKKDQKYESQQKIIVTFVIHLMLFILNLFKLAFILDYLRNILLEYLESRDFGD